MFILIKKIQDFSCEIYLGKFRFNIFFSNNSNLYNKTIEPGKTKFTHQKFKSEQSPKFEKQLAQICYSNQFAFGFN
jgi:hypothetical protein